MCSSDLLSLSLSRGYEREGEACGYILTYHASRAECGLSLFGSLSLFPSYRGKDEAGYSDSILARLKED